MKLCSYHDDREGEFICFSALCKDRYKILCKDCVSQDTHLKHQHCKIQELFDMINTQKMLKRTKNEQMLQEITKSGESLCENIQEEITKLTQLKVQLSKSISSIVNHFSVHIDIDAGMEDDNPTSKSLTNQDFYTYLSNIINFQSYSFDFQINSKQNFIGVQLNNIKNLLSSERFQFYKYPIEDLKERISEVRKYSNQVNQSQSEFEISLKKQNQDNSSKDVSLSGKKQSKQINRSDFNKYHQKTRKLSTFLKDCLFINPSSVFNNFNYDNNVINNDANEENKKNTMNNKNKHEIEWQIAGLKVNDSQNNEKMMEQFLSQLESEGVREVKIEIEQEKIDGISSSNIHNILNKMKKHTPNIVAFSLKASTKILKMFENEKLSAIMNNNWSKTLKSLEFGIVFSKTNEYESYQQILSELKMQGIQKIHLNYILSYTQRYQLFFQNHANINQIHLDIFYSLPSQIENFFQLFFQNQIHHLKIISLFLHFHIKKKQKQMQYLLQISLDSSHITCLKEFLESQKNTLQHFEISKNVCFNSSVPLEESLFSESLVIDNMKSLNIKFQIIEEQDVSILLSRVERVLPNIQQCHLFPEFDALYDNAHTKKHKLYQQVKIAKLLAILKWKLITFSTQMLTDIFYQACDIHHIFPNSIIS